jgi:CheY-like chemotaxis protein
MSDNRFTSRGGGTTVCRSAPDPAKRTAPRLILGGRAFAARMAAHLRDLGWDVHAAADGAEARRLALRKRPYAVLLPVDAEGESGYLTCAKLRQALPRVKVVLVGRERTAEAERFAGFVGAAFATESGVVDELNRLVRGGGSEG